MSPTLRLAFLYALAALASGFMLGPLREWVVAPRIGRLGATLAEMPLLLGFCWVVAGRLVRRLPARAARIRMGVAAVALLLVFEFTLGVALRGWNLSEWLADFLTAPGLVTMLAYLLMAAWPALQAAPVRRTADPSSIRR